MSDARVLPQGGAAMGATYQIKKIIIGCLDGAGGDAVRVCWRQETLTMNGGKGCWPSWLRTEPGQNGTEERCHARKARSCLKFLIEPDRHGQVWKSCMRGDSEIRKKSGSEEVAKSRSAMAGVVRLATLSSASLEPRGALRDQQVPVGATVLER